PAPARPGKSGMAVGQLAKQAVAAAREAGIELPSNAQGMAASQIAKGAAPESIFAAYVSEDATDVPQEDVVATDTVTAPLDAAPVPKDVPQSPSIDGAETMAQLAATQYDTANKALAGSGDSSAQIALDLLS
ncbi:MAG: hypothetical protein AB8B47_03870, partial [Roseobacter sp.]